MKTFIRLVIILGLVAVPKWAGLAASPPLTLLNVSYDPTRELYQDYNAAFARHWKETKGKDVIINQSHGGSVKQTRAVIDGEEADVVTLALAPNIDALAQHGLVAKNWQSRLPDNSSPYTTTIVFVVRKGNPKGIHDWPDLVKQGVQVITPNPKTSGGARWAYLAAWVYALKANHNDEAKTRQFVTALYKNVPVLDSGARGSTTTFAQRGMGDVLLSWENEAYLIQREFGAANFEIIAPSISIQAEPPIALVDKVVEKHGTREVARAYLEWLWSAEGQDIAGRNFYRPRLGPAFAKYAANFPKINLFSVNQAFGGWDAAERIHFADGGVFDQIYKP